MGGILMPFQKIQFQEQSISLFQDNVDRALIPIQNAPLVGGQILSNVSLISGQDNLISHTLGYSPTIILPMAPNVNSTIWSPTTVSLFGSNVSTTQINLRCSSSCIASVVVK